MKKVITYGTFDLLHRGHVRLLERAKALGDYLIVGVTADDFDIARGKINIQQSLIERIQNVKATGIADEIIIESYEGQKIDDIRRYDVDIFTVGSDWKGRFDYLKEHCEVIYLERTEGVSSTEIRSDERKLLIGTIGNENLRKKFINEMAYVDGVEYCESRENFEGADAMYIATHPKRRSDDILLALNQGKHVICESPIALNSDKVAFLFDVARKNKLVLFDAIKTAYSTAYSRMLVIAKSGCIGDIVSVDSVCTSLAEGAGERGANLSIKQNSICAWGPMALLPIFQLLGVEYKNLDMCSKIINKEELFDGFTRINLVYDTAVATAKLGKAAKSEGELIITGTIGYIYVPSPWWKTDYFEVRYENPENNKRYFYQLEGEGIRHEIVAFSKNITGSWYGYNVSEEISVTISRIMEKFYNRDFVEI